MPTCHRTVSPLVHETKTQIVAMQVRQARSYGCTINSQRPTASTSATIAHPSVAGGVGGGESPVPRHSDRPHRLRAPAGLREDQEVSLLDCREVKWRV